MSNALKLANKKIDADATDRTITYVPVAAENGQGFTRLFVDCRDATAEMVFSIDEPIASAVKAIYLKPGDLYDDVVCVSGQALHYSGAGVFRYRLY